MHHDRSIEEIKEVNENKDVRKFTMENLQIDMVESNFLIPQFDHHSKQVDEEQKELSK